MINNWQETNLKNINHLDQERRVLNQILTAIDSSIVLFDENLAIIKRNNQLEYLYENTGLEYLNLIKDIEIVNILKNILMNKIEIKEEIYILRLKKHFSIFTKYLEDDKRFLLVIRDITAIKEMVEIQKTFVSNISHELKTPLTNIKGYVIALDENPPEIIKNQFLQTIKNNIDKLENIVSDFLNISKIENSKILKLEHISIDKIKIELNLSLNERINISKAKITYNFALLNKSKDLFIDFEKVLTILKNLVENAIIYRSEKGPEIDISIIETRNMYKIGVKDNGIGISKENIENIFERFYRVDKARTSNKAGTGLGLSIVKELVDIYGGKIEVISNEGKGSLFIFTILK